MYQACKTGQLPSIEIMCLYGLSGFNGTNPLAIFECYKSAIKYDSITESQLSDAMGRGTLDKLIMKSPSIQKSPYYLEVMKMGGIQVPVQVAHECSVCGFYSVSRTCTCTGTGRLSS